MRAEGARERLQAASRKAEDTGQLAHSLARRQG